MNFDIQERRCIFGDLHAVLTVLTLQKYCRYLQEKQLLCSYEKWLIFRQNNCFAIRSAASKELNAPLLGLSSDVKWPILISDVCSLEHMKC